MQAATTPRQAPRPAALPARAPQPAPQQLHSKAGPPSLERQKEFIIQNSYVLGREAKLAILSTVMNEVVAGGALAAGALAAAPSAGSPRPHAAGSDAGAAESSAGFARALPAGELDGDAESLGLLARGAVTEAGSTKEVNIDLDLVGRLNPDVVAHIYNIVLARREALCQPAGAAGT